MTRDEMKKYIKATSQVLDDIEDYFTRMSKNPPDENRIRNLISCWKDITEKHYEKCCEPTAIDDVQAVEAMLHGARDACPDMAEFFTDARDILNRALSNMKKNM